MDINISPIISLLITSSAALCLFLIMSTVIIYLLMWTGLALYEIFDKDGKINQKIKKHKRQRNVEKIQKALRKYDNVPTKQLRNLNEGDMVWLYLKFSHTLIPLTLRKPIKQRQDCITLWTDEHRYPQDFYTDANLNHSYITCFGDTVMITSFETVMKYAINKHYKIKTVHFPFPNQPIRLTEDNFTLQKFITILSEYRRMSIYRKKKNKNN